MVFREKSKVTWVVEVEVEVGDCWLNSGSGGDRVMTGRGDGGLASSIPLNRPIVVV